MDKQIADGGDDSSFRTFRKDRLGRIQMVAQAVDKVSDGMTNVLSVDDRKSMVTATTEMARCRCGVRGMDRFAEESKFGL